jgi:putative FmdB family regulatory protein
MPNYDYYCENCSHKFEQFQKIKDRLKPCKKPCPNCKEKKVDMLIGAPAACDPIRIGTTKPDKGWQEVLAKIKEKNPRSNLNSRF